MDRAGRNKDMVVLFYRIFPYIFICVEFSCSLGIFKFTDHFILIYAVLQTEIYYCIFSGIEHIIAFFLRVVHPELFLYIFCQRMHL